MISDVLSSGQLDTRPASGSGADTSAIEASMGGKGLPVSGTSVAAAANTRPAFAPIDISRAIEHLDQFLKSSQRSLSFRVDEGSGRTIITVLNEATGEIVRQIPAEEVLTLARTIRGLGLVFDALA